MSTRHLLCASWHVGWDKATRKPHKGSTHLVPEPRKLLGDRRQSDQKIRRPQPRPQLCEGIQPLPGRRHLKHQPAQPGRQPDCRAAPNDLGATVCLGRRGRRRTAVVAIGVRGSSRDRGGCLKPRAQQLFALLPPLVPRPPAGRVTRVTRAGVAQRRGGGAAAAARALGV